MNFPGKSKKTVGVVIIASLYFLIFPVISQSQSETADPNKLAADQAACQQHAMAFSGYNPAAPEQPTDSSPPPQRGAGLRGGARGAAKGAVAGGARARRNAKQQAPPPPPAPAGDPALYSSSYKDCMASKGYAVK